MVELKDMFGGGRAPETFLGLAKVEDWAAPGGDIVFYGADCATPYASVGAYCAGGAAAMRAGAEAYAGDLSRVNFDLGGPVLPDGVRAVDAGDVATSPGDAAGNRARIAEATRAILSAGAVPVLLGGDDSVPIPMLDAFAGHGPLCVLQIDAHIDWRDEVEGERMGLSSTMRRASEMAHVERIVQVGARGIGSAGMAELEAARDWGAHLVPAHELASGGLQRAVDLIPDGARVVICFDCDALDPSIMPAVIAPTAGGLSYGQALSLIGGVAAKARIAGLDLVEFMPERDRDGDGARLAAQLLTAVLGIVGRQVAAGR
ncbi:MAG: arginase family protein [Jhaorihella sp.]